MPAIFETFGDPENQIKHLLVEAPGLAVTGEWEKIAPAKR